MGFMPLCSFPSGIPCWFWPSCWDSVGLWQRFPAQKAVLVLQPLQLQPVQIPPFWNGSFKVNNFILLPSKGCFLHQSFQGAFGIAVALKAPPCDCSGLPLSIIFISLGLLSRSPGSWGCFVNPTPCHDVSSLLNGKIKSCSDVI